LHNDADWLSVDDVVTNAINSLNAISRLRRPAFGSIFLLNNISYLRRHLLLQSNHPDLSPLISQPIIDTINSNWRTAKAAYFDTNFSPLMQAISDDPKEKSGKSQAKEKFTRFFDLLEEVVERHRMAKVLGEDKEARDAVADEIVMVVIPSLSKFTQKQKEKEFSRSGLLFTLLLELTFIGYLISQIRRSVSWLVHDIRNEVVDSYVLCVPQISNRVQMMSKPDFEICIISAYQYQMSLLFCLTLLQMWIEIFFKVNCSLIGLCPSYFNALFLCCHELKVSMVPVRDSDVPFPQYVRYCPKLYY